MHSKYQASLRFTADKYFSPFLTSSLLSISFAKWKLFYKVPFASCCGPHWEDIQKKRRREDHECPLLLAYRGFSLDKTRSHMQETQLSAMSIAHISISEGLSPRGTLYGISGSQFVASLVKNPIIEIMFIFWRTLTYFSNADILNIINEFYHLQRQVTMYLILFRSLNILQIQI